MKNKESKGIKCKSFIFHSDFSAELKKGVIKDGTVIVDDMEFPVDEIKPFIIKTGFGSPKQFYFLKHDTLHPAGFENKKEVIEYKKTGNVEADASNYLKFVKRIRHLGFKKKVIPTSTFISEQLKPLDIEFYKQKGKESPKLLKETADMRFLKGMKSYVTPKGGIGGGSILGYFLAFAVGLFWMLIILYLTNNIKL
jgi:hypothetical protein